MFLKFQLGLTATPKRKDNVDTYKYFGEPVYVYSLKEGINDGFLTPFKVKRIKTTLDEYLYVSDDYVLEGEVEEGKIYKESDFNRIIEIKEREAKRVQILLSEINQKEKAIVFCATQVHASAIRDLINQYSNSKDPLYCVRVTANDGALGEQEEPGETKQKPKIKLRDGKEREIQHMISTSFWSADGKPISSEEFLHNLYGTLPDFFKSEDELREIWSNPRTRKGFLEKLSDAGYGNDELATLQSLINAENSIR